MKEDDKKNKNMETHVDESVTTGSVVQKSKLQKALGVLLADDIDNIKGSIVEDYIKPRSKSFMMDSVYRIREFIADTVNGLVGAILFPKNRNGSEGGYYKGTYVNYKNSYNVYKYNGSDYYADNRVDKVPPTRVKLIVIRSRGEAQDVLGSLISICNRYDCASVAAYYELVNITPSKEDYNYGWFGLTDTAVEILSRDGGYVLDLPKPVPLRS